MFLKEFYSRSNPAIQVTAEQASRFAKEIAGDFNPLHDPDSRRFCVPGDLLFALVLEKYGLSTDMHFTFSNMVGHGINLIFPEQDSNTVDIHDDKSNTYLKVDHDGENTTDTIQVENFIQNYVAFSGLNFPHVLVPLMAEQNTMINTNRPLVIYESMSFKLHHLNFTDHQIVPADNTLEVNGRRGEAHLHFDVLTDDGQVGHGFKKILISGIREYDHDIIHTFTENYLAHKHAYQQQIPESVSS